MPGGLLASLGIVMVPLIVYSLQYVMHWHAPVANTYTGFYYWIHSQWVPMEICTLFIACLTLYFIRFPFISFLIYFVISFMCMDAIDLLTDPRHQQWLYYCLTAITMGACLNILGFSLYRNQQNDFGFWSYLYGMFLCWSGLICWQKETEVGYFICFLISFSFVLLSNFFHRKIFLFFGFLGIIYYIAHLSSRFPNSSLFSYILGAIGFAMIMLAVLLPRLRQRRRRIS